MLQNGYVEIGAGIPLTGFEFVGGPQSFSALVAQEEEVGRLLAPQFFADSAGGTWQSLCG